MTKGRYRRVRLHQPAPFWKVSIPDIVPVHAAFPEPPEDPILQLIGRAALVWDEDDGSIAAFCALDDTPVELADPLAGFAAVTGTKPQFRGGMRFYVGGSVTAVLLATAAGAVPVSAHPSRQ